MNAQEDDTPSGLPPHDPERDVLAERRARRGEPVGDPILIRRAETAEATAHALQERLAGIQARLQEAEQASRETSQRLAEREQELTRASQRLSEGELQLRTISTRLADRERELHTVSERLSDRERDLSAVSERLAQREQQLARAELEIRGRVDALERRVEEVQEDLARERAARLAAESELEALKAAQAAVQPLVGDLRQIAGRLRALAEAGGPTAEADASLTPGPLAWAEQPASPEELAGIVAPPAAVAPSAQAEASSEQMAEALAAAIQRLRARVVAVGELQESEAEPGRPAAESSAAPVAAEPAAEPAPEPAVPASTPYVPPPLIERAPPRAWLAPAIRRVAERRDPRLAAELVLELLPAQALSVKKPVRYLAKIAELGAYEVSLTGGRGSVRDLAGVGLIDAHTFLLEGPAAAFAEVAAGGSRISAWRPPAGLRIRGGRRRARPLLGSRRAPLALSDLERAGVTVWPGLLLLALAEAIDPASTAGHSFTVAFAIEAQQSAVLQVQALQGRPLAVTRGAADEQAQGALSVTPGPAQSTLHLSERAFTRLLTAEDLDGETVMLEGEPGPLETLLSWTDRVQGIRRFGA